MQIDKLTEAKTNFRTESISINRSELPILQSIRSNSIVTSTIEEKPKKIKLNFMQHLTKKSPLIIRKQVKKGKKILFSFFLYLYSSPQHPNPMN